MSRSKRELAMVCIATFLVVVCGASFGQYVTQQVGDNGVVDWSQQKVRAVGIAAPNPDLPTAAQRPAALEAAKQIALRNLIQTVQGMAISSETLVRNAMLENDEIRSKVEGYIRGFTVVDTKYMSDMTVEVEVEVPVSGVADVLLPPGKAVPIGTEVTGYPEATPTTTPGVITGLIVDAKGLGVMPAMAPRILDEEGNEVYGSRYVNREWAVKQGMVGYDKAVASARKNKRVGANPMIVKGIKSAGTNKADIVISNEDAAAVKQAADTQNFLDKCQVMFVLD